MNYIKIVLVVLFFALFLGGSLILFYNGKKTLLKSSFGGKIEKITYDEKNIADVTINNVEYNLTPLRKEFKQEVMVGDSLVKIKNQSYYKVIKQGTGREIKFDF